MRKSALFTFCLVLLLAACQTTRGPQELAAQHILQQQACNAPFEFIVVQLNDIYELSPLDGGRIGGMARVATVLHQLEQKNPDTIAILSGDFLSPSLISSLEKIVGGQKIRIAGEQMVAAMNATGIDYVTFGNHEFDISEDSLQARLNESRFAYVSSNVLHKHDSLLKPFEQIRAGQATAVPEYLIHSLHRPGCANIRLGLIGLTLPFNQKNYVQYEDVLSSGKRAYLAAAAESDLVFALTHLSIAMDRELARAIPGLSLIMGGHEHEHILDNVGQTRIAKADANARTVYIHWVVYHPDTEDVEIWSQLMPVTEDIEEDAAVASLIQSWESTANDAIRNMGYEPNDVVARFDVPYDGREASVRNKPTNLGRAVACAMLAGQASASFAFLNSGSIRVDDVLTGEVTQRDVLRTLPFGGEIVLGSFSGDVLKKILQSGLHTNIGEGGYLQTTPNVEERNGDYYIGGAALQVTENYQAILPAFLSAGRESNLEFMATSGQYRSLNLTDDNVSPRNDLRDVTIQYLKSRTGNWDACPY